MKNKHESYGILDIGKFVSNGSQFFGSDLIHNGGVRIVISEGEKTHNLNRDWYSTGANLIEIEMSYNQFVDAITSGMNTAGVPCTIKRYGKKRMEQIDHVINKKEQFSNSMSDTQQEYKNRIDEILSKLDGNIGKRKADEIKHDLKVLKNHITRNTDFVMTSFNEAMEKTVVEAKHSVANYIDHKIHSLGIEGIKKEVQISIESDEKRNNSKHNRV